MGFSTVFTSAGDWNHKVALWVAGARHLRRNAVLPSEDSTPYSWNITRLYFGSRAAETTQKRGISA